MSGTRAGSASAVVGWAGPLGFTLVEVLVVIGVIALLTAVLLPTMSKARGQANNLVCQSNLHQIGQAIQIYIGSSRGVLPYGYWDGTFDLNTGVDRGYDGSRGADWSVLLQSCMSANGGPTYNANGTGGLLTQLRGVFMDPDAPPGETHNSFHFTLTQYASHPRLMPMLGGQDGYLESAAPAGVKYFLRPYRVGRIKRSGEIGLIFDSSLVAVLGGGWSASASSVPVAVAMDGGRINAETFLTDQYNLAAAGMSGGDSLDMTPAKSGDGNVDGANNAQNVRFRHMNNRVCNVLMADMHVQSFWTTELKRGNVYVNP